jgi:hypothetical protein
MLIQTFPGTLLDLFSFGWNSVFQQFNKTAGQETAISFSQ